jgi:hypothetical protein
LDLNRRRGAECRLSVLVGIVQVRHRLEFRVEQRHVRVGEKRRFVELAPAARLEEGGNPEPIGVQQVLDEGRQADSIGSRERLAKPSNEGNAGVDPVAEPTYDTTNERWMEKRHICRRHVRDLATTPKCRQTDAETTKWPAALLEVVEDVEGVGKQGECLARRTDQHDGTPHATCHEPRDAPHERGTVPLQDRLWTAHARRTPPDEDDPGVAVQDRQSPLRSGAEAVR